MSIKEKLMHYSWDIAYGTYTEDILFKGLRGVLFNIIKNPYSNKWFADPFILDEDENTIQFLVEEFDCSLERGRIARLFVDKTDNIIKECSIILDLPTHLSFPVIYRVGDEIYVHPENSASGASYIYKYDRETDKLVEPKLMVNDPITDAVIKKDEDCYRLFATKVPEPNGCTLHEYRASSLFGPYKYVCSENFVNNQARMAGMFIETSSGPIRPAQDCCGDYGKAVVFYGGHKQLAILKPCSYNQAGIHTFNILNSTFVVDIKKYDFPLFYKFIRMIKHE